METFYLCIVVFLFMLAIFDLSVGVSNDAVNFLNSAVGSRAASFKTIIIVAAIGVFAGAALSNGMMDIARHGIFHPQHFYFSDIMCILLAVMLTDVVLLDIFNSLGMPTSTTVSMIFELVGATVALSLVKIYGSDGAYQLGDLMNTEKAFTVILSIFLSVAVAFFFGALVQYIARLLFSFNYKKNSRFFIGIFGGLAATAIIYFMLIKGLKTSTFMEGDLKAYIHDNTGMIVLISFVSLSILMQLLHIIGVNVLKVVVLLGTFALALAFAGNDLVNFIGVPLAGYSAFTDWMAQGGGVSPDSFLMVSLQESARTPWYFLFGAGVVMVFSLITSRKAKNVIKTSLDLSRQTEGDESFGSSLAARTIVRAASNMTSAVALVIPQPVKNWVDTRFTPIEVPKGEEVTFDLVRASVNVVLAGLLIAFGTSYKLPLSTTYVVFMVAMGSSLADRAWGRESAVFRITGVLSVIGGWFITAGAAFSICFAVVLIIYYGGPIAIVLLVALAVYILIHSQISYKKKLRRDAVRDQVNNTVAKLRDAQDTTEALDLFRMHSREEHQQMLTFVGTAYQTTFTAFTQEDAKELRYVLREVMKKKTHIKQVKRVGTLGVARLDEAIAIEKGLYYYQGNDFASEILFSTRRLIENCKEHVENNFNPLNEAQNVDMQQIAQQVSAYMNQVAKNIQDNNYATFNATIDDSETLIKKIVLARRAELKRLQGDKGSSTKVNMLYLTMLQESQNMVAFTANLLKSSRKFQTEVDADE